MNEPLLEVIEDLERLRSVAEPWKTLLDSLHEGSPFVSHEWLCAWWSHFGRAGGLHLVLGWRGARLIGIAPLMLGRERRLGIPLRRLGTLYNDHVQDCDFPLLESERQAFLEALWQHLLTRGLRWDLLELCQLRQGSQLLGDLQRRAASAGLRSHSWEQGESPWLPLQGSWEDCLARLSSRRRAEYRRQFRRLAEQGGTSLETISGGPELDEAVEAALRIEALGWKGGAGTAILGNSRLHMFYHDLAGRMALRGALRLYFLRVGEQRVAFQYCLLLNGRLSLLKTGFDPAWHSHSPSQLLVWLVLQQAFAQGLREYDLLGDREDWKMVWATHTCPHVWFSLMGRSLPGQLFGLLKRQLVPLHRRCLRVLRRPLAPAPPGTWDSGSH